MDYLNVESEEYFKRLDEEVKIFFKSHPYNQEVYFELSGMISAIYDLGVEMDRDILWVNPKRIREKASGKDFLWEKLFGLIGVKNGIDLRLPHDFDEMFIYVPEQNNHF